jgi:DNA-binding NarL/FixJ family response regulator
MFNQKNQLNKFAKFFKRKSLVSKSIFIVEDNEVYAKLLKSFIYTRFPNVNEIKIFRIGEMCLTELHSNPDIVLIDYFLNAKYEEAQNGLEIIKRIKHLKPNTNIIVLSNQTNISVILEAIRQYDCFYVQKDEGAFNKVEQFINEIFKRENSPAFESLN